MRRLATTSDEKSGLESPPLVSGKRMFLQQLAQQRPDWETPNTFMTRFLFTTAICLMLNGLPEAQAGVIDQPEGVTLKLHSPKSLPGPPAPSGAPTTR